MVTKLNVCEVFPSIAGEGKYVGYPVVFLRLQYCTRQCNFCDTNYYKTGKPVSIVKLATLLSKQSLRTIVITGGEPLLQWGGILELWRLLSKDRHFSIHTESNGDLLYSKKVTYSELFSICDYVAISPKEVRVAKQLYKDLPGPLSKGFCDIKVVTDLDKVGKGMIKYATVLMPLTTYDKQQDEEIRKKVWNYCVKYNIRYSPRIHYEVWGSKRGV